MHRPRPSLRERFVASVLGVVLLTVGWLLLLLAGTPIWTRVVYGVALFLLLDYLFTSFWRKKRS